MNASMFSFPLEVHIKNVLMRKVMEKVKKVAQMKLKLPAMFKDLKVATNFHVHKQTFSRFYSNFFLYLYI